VSGSNSTIIVAAGGLPRW